MTLKMYAHDQVAIMPNRLKPCWTFPWWGIGLIARHIANKVFS